MHDAIAAAAMKAIGPIPPPHGAQGELNCAPSHRAPLRAALRPYLPGGRTWPGGGGGGAAGVRSL